MLLSFVQHNHSYFLIIVWLSLNSQSLWQICPFQVSSFLILKCKKDETMFLIENCISNYSPFSFISFCSYKFRQWQWTLTFLDFDKASCSSSLNFQSNITLEWSKSLWLRLSFSLICEIYRKFSSLPERFIQFLACALGSFWVWKLYKSSAFGVAFIVVKESCSNWLELLFFEVVHELLLFYLVA